MYYFVLSHPSGFQNARLKQLKQILTMADDDFSSHKLDIKVPVD